MDVESEMSRLRKHQRESLSNFKVDFKSYKQLYTHYLAYIVWLVIQVPNYMLSKKEKAEGPSFEVSSKVGSV